MQILINKKKIIKTNYLKITKKYIKKKKQKVFSPAGNRTPVSRVTGGDTYHYTTEDVIVIVKFRYRSVNKLIFIYVIQILTFVNILFFYNTRDSNTASLAYTYFYFISK